MGQFWVEINSRKPSQDRWRCGHRDFYRFIRQLIADVFVMKLTKDKEVLCPDVPLVLQVRDVVRVDHVLPEGRQVNV